MKLGKRQEKQVIKLIVGIVILLAGYFANTYVEPPPQVAGTVSPGYYRVTKVEDGDTITVDMDGTQERVRLIGVDTPETQDPRKPVQCYGRVASNFTKELIGNQNVRLESDPLSDNRDRYNRLLRYVYLSDGRLVQAEIIRQGYGFAYTSFPFTKSDEFLSFQRVAIDQNLGLWNSCQPTTNKYGSFTSNPEGQ